MCSLLSWNRHFQAILLFKLILGLLGPYSQKVTLKHSEGKLRYSRCAWDAQCWRDPIREQPPEIVWVPPVPAGSICVLRSPGQAIRSNKQLIFSLSLCVYIYNLLIISSSLNLSHSLWLSLLFSCIISLSLFSLSLILFSHSHSFFISRSFILSLSLSLSLALSFSRSLSLYISFSFSFSKNLLKPPDGV